VLAERIIQLGGKPLLEPEEWYQQSDCGYEAPSDASTVNVLEQSIEGEQCAIYIDKRLVDITHPTQGSSNLRFGSTDPER